MRGREEVDLVCQVVEQVESPACPHQVVDTNLDLRTHMGFCVVVGGCKRRARTRAGKRARGGGGEEEQQVAALEGARWRCTARLEIFQLVT